MFLASLLQPLDEWAIELEALIHSEDPVPKEMDKRNHPVVTNSFKNPESDQARMEYNVLNSEKNTNRIGTRNDE